VEDVKWLTEREERAWRGMQIMQRRLDREMNRQLAADSGLSYSDYLVLVVLTAQDDGRLRLFELGELLSWEKSRLSHHVARMSKRDLLVKESCDEDRRGAYVVITDHGRSEIEAAAPGHLETVRRLFIDLLTPAQLDTLAEIAETVLDEADERGRDQR
jgi:DNA-binding MarR family transcriptional regulator